MKSALVQKFKEMKASLHPWKEGPSLVADPPFYLQTNFLSNVDTLWSQFEKQMTAAVESNDGLTALLYVFRRDTYQFLTATAERFFSQEALNELTDALRAWGKDTIGCSYVTTPQLRVYVDGCRRELLRDSTEARWHYLVSLTRNKARDAGRIKLISESVSGPRNHAAGVASLIDLQLQFNQLLVHDTRRAYGIASARTGMDAIQGSLFLDGYLW
ncbi:MAG: hypothetical protein LAO20_21650 [Acidobacteriia bacterium]|nr:hypothetical protein [Terriglobia bacterium]